MNRAQHAAATAALTVTLFPLGVINPDAFLFAGGAALGLVLHPDLDQSDTLYGQVRRHRGFSHVPVLGTLDRALWFLGPALLAWGLSGRLFDWTALIYLFVGLCTADGLHILLDAIT